MLEEDDMSKKKLRSKKSGEAAIQKREDQLILAYKISPPADPIKELAKWRATAEFAFVVMLEGGKHGR